MIIYPNALSQWLLGNDNYSIFMGPNGHGPYNEHGAE